MKNLKDRMETLVEGWSTKEPDWLAKAPEGPASPSEIVSSFRERIINEYKASAAFKDVLLHAVATEFEEGFEFARSLVRGRGHDPDALGMIVPEDEEGAEDVGQPGDISEAPEAFENFESRTVPEVSHIPENLESSGDLKESDQPAASDHFEGSGQPVAFGDPRP